MTTKRLPLGYLGISEGELSINIVAVGKSGAVYCLPCSAEDAHWFATWDENGRIVDLEDIFPDLPVAVTALLYFGIEEDLDELDGDPITFSSETPPTN